MKIINNCDLTLYNSYRIKAICQRCFFPNSEKDLIKIFYNYPQTNKIILGNGNNVILTKPFYDDDFIIFNGNLNKIEVFNDIILAQSGATMEALSEVALNHSLSGLEVFCDIPSSVGGAVVMNAGTSEKEIKDILIKVQYLDLFDKKIKEITTENINYKYRNSFFLDNKDVVILKAWFHLTPKRKFDIMRTMINVKQKRWAKQPRDYPNAGSVFKRPEGRYVGAMIEELELKGYSIGGAKVSEKHAGFIINFNEASGSDIINLISFIKDKVKQRFFIELEIEQRFL